MFLHDPQHTGRSPYRGPQSGKVEWMFDAKGYVYSSPTLDVNGNIYFSVMQGAFFLGLRHRLFPEMEGRSISHKSRCLRFGAMAAKHGNSAQIQLMHYFYEPTLSLDGSTLYVPGQKALYAIDTSGSLKWKFPGGTSSPAVDNDGNIYFASASSLYSLTPAGGIRWALDNIYAGGFDTGPAIGPDGTIYLHGIFFLYAIDYSGKLRWKYDLSVGSGSMPAIDADGTIYFGRNTQRTPADSINFIALNSNGTVKFLVSLRSPDGTAPDIDSRPAISNDGKISVGSDRPHGFHLYKIK